MYHVVLFEDETLYLNCYIKWKINKQMYFVEITGMIW